MCVILFILQVLNKDHVHANSANATMIEISQQCHKAKTVVRVG